MRWVKRLRRAPRGWCGRACGYETWCEVVTTLAGIVVRSRAPLDSDVRDRCCDVAAVADRVLDGVDARDSKLDGNPSGRRVQSVPDRRRAGRPHSCLGMERS